MFERIVLGPHASGVGDNLLYGRIPELCKLRNREAEVWIGVGGQNPNWRNSETYDLIWGKNSHVSGFTTDAPTCGVATIVNDFIGEVKRRDNQIAAVEFLHGFGTENTRPKLYYEPKLRVDVRDKILCSPTSVSCPMPGPVIDEFVAEVGRWYGFDSREVIVLRSRHDGRWGQDALRENRRLDVANVYEWVDLIFSAGLFLTSESGGSAIAAAVRAPKTTHAVCSVQTFNDKLWLWEGVIYRASSRIPGLPGGGDYHPYPKTNRPVGVWGEVAVR